MRRPKIFVALLCALCMSLGVFSAFAPPAEKGVAFYGASLTAARADETHHQEPASSPSPVVDTSPSIESANASPTSSLNEGVPVKHYIAALTVGKDIDEGVKRRWRMAMLIMEPYFAMQASQGASLTIYPIKNNSDFNKTAKSYSLETLTQCGEALHALQNVTYARYSGEKNTFKKAYLDMARSLNAYTKNIAEETEIWLVDGRKPLYIDELASDPAKEAADKLIEMLNDKQKVTLNFLYISDEADAYTAQGVRMDEYVRAHSVNGVKKVFTHDVLTDRFLDQLHGVISNQSDLRLIVGSAINEAIQDADNKAKYVVRYAHQPWDNAGDAMLLVTHSSSDNSAIKNVEIVAQVEKDTTAVSATPIFIDDACWLIAPKLPAGEYEVHITFASEQKQPELSVTPYLCVNKDARRVSMELPAERPLYRDDTFVKIMTDAVQLPRNRWTPSLTVNGNVLLESVKDAEAGDGIYAWTIAIPAHVLKVGQNTLKAELTITKPDDFSISTPNETLDIVNREVTKRANAQVEYDAFCNIISGNGEMTPEPVCLAMSELFEDSDRDKLTYEIISVEYSSLYDEDTIIQSVPISQSTYDNEGFCLEIADNERLVYTPKNGEWRINITVRAKDGYEEPAGGAVLVLQFHQYDMARILSEMRLVPVEGGGVRKTELSTDDDALNMRWHAELARQSTLCFVLKEQLPGATMRLLNAAGEQYKLPPFRCVLTYTYQHGDASEERTANIEPITFDGVQTLGFSVVLPAITTNGEFHYTFDKDVVYGGVNLPFLTAEADVTVGVHNDKPTLNEKTLHQNNEGYSQELNDMRDMNSVFLSNVLGVKELRPDSWFIDQETPNDLDYIIDVAALDEEDFVFLVNGEAVTSVQSEASRQYKLGKGDYFNLELKKPGVYQIIATAHDDEYKSEPMSISVTVTSMRERVFMTALYVLAGIIVLVVLILTVIHMCKPSFGNKRVGIFITDNNEEPETPAPIFPLKRYGKKSVTLLSLALALQQPVPSRQFAQLLSEIRLFPARAGASSVLQCGKHARDVRLSVGKGIVPSSRATKIQTDQIIVLVQTYRIALSFSDGMKADK